jgi:hypothetical protein
MTFVRRSFVLAAVVIGVGLSAHANLLSNGSFESGNFVNDGNGAMTLLVGSTAMTDWTVQNASLAWILSGSFGLTASQDSYFLDLSGYHDNSPYAGVALSQTIATTIGAQYQLSFDIGTDTRYNSSTPVSIQVTAGSASYTGYSTASGIDKWESRSFVFTASSALTTISLNGQSTDLSQKYIGLDNVNFILVPEPSTLTLLAGPGLLVFAAWRRLRRA